LDKPSQGQKGENISAKLNMPIQIWHSHGSKMPLNPQELRRNQQQDYFPPSVGVRFVGGPTGTFPETPQLKYTQKNQ
jgi:hypothetical protein